jgi:hypothetical protein
MGVGDIPRSFTVRIDFLRPFFIRGRIIPFMMFSHLLTIITDILYSQYYNPRQSHQLTTTL